MVTSCGKSICAPLNCETGISHSLNRAPSSCICRSRTIKVLFNFSCSGNPVVSMASNRATSFLACARSSSINFCEKSSSWSFHRLSPKNDAAIGLLRIAYSHRSASKSFKAFRRAAKSPCCAAVFVVAAFVAALACGLAAAAVAQNKIAPQQTKVLMDHLPLFVPNACDSTLSPRVSRNCSGYQASLHALTQVAHSSNPAINQM